MCSNAEASNKAVWALDFDGVVCNSVGESSLTAWKVPSDRSDLTAYTGIPPILQDTRAFQAAEQHWPDVFKSEQAQSKMKKVLQDMQTVRPVIETG